MPREFTAEEDAIILGHPRREATRMLHLARTTVQRRYLFLVNPTKYFEQEERRAKGYVSAATEINRPRPSPGALAERDRRMELQHATVGAMLMGDPLPGYSALDRRR
jgi:hypothetical protein